MYLVDEYRYSRSIILIHLFLVIVFNAGLTHASIIEVYPGEYIQEAIDKADPGDAIEVINGTYRENIEVDKRLTLRGINMPVIWSCRSGSTVNISADGCVIEGINAANSSGWHQAGIRVTSEDNIIQNNIVQDSRIGIVLLESSGNRISSNDARNGGTGIMLMNSSNNIIEDNKASSQGMADFGGAGIYLLGGCDNNAIHNNAVSMSGPINMGIMIYSSQFNKVEDNIIVGNGWFSGMGITLFNSTHSLIKNNIVVSNGIFGQAIRLMFSHQNAISYNDVCCYGPIGQAIVILQSDHNLISRNKAASWQWGLDMEFEGSYGNRLLDNSALRIRGQP